MITRQPVRRTGTTFSRRIKAHLCHVLIQRLRHRLPLSRPPLRPRRLHTRCVLWSLLFLSSLLSLLPAAARADAVSNQQEVLMLDFEKGDLAGWRHRPGDEPFLRCAISQSDEALSGMGSLRGNADGWDTLRAGNEQVEFRYDLQHPIEIDSTTEISWIWRIADTTYRDGVGLTLFVAFGDSTKDVTWFSHSQFDRGRAHERTDPAGKRIFHRFGILAEMRARRPDLMFPSRGRLQRVQVQFMRPVGQIAWIDDILVGPPAMHPEFSDIKTLPVPIFPQAVDLQAADLDGDGRCDLITGIVEEPPRITWGRRDLRTTSRASGEGYGLDSARSMASICVQDLDGDGTVDLAGLAGDRLRLFRGLGRGHFQEIPCPQLSPMRDWDPYRLLVAELLPGGGPELVVHRKASMYHDTLFTSAHSWKYRPVPFPPPSGPWHVTGYRWNSAIADVDNDGDLDIFSCNSDLYLQDGGRLVCATETWLPERGNHQTGAVFGDIDRDGRMDLFITVDIMGDSRDTTRASRPTHRHCLLYRNDGDHFTDVSSWIQAPKSRHARNPLMEDFDLDGDLDIFYTCNPLQEPPRGDPALDNVYLDNDGRGRFRPPAGDSWIGEIPPCRQALSYDADDDGAPDLVYVPWGGMPPQLERNPLARGHWIKVRVLDHHGAPHAGGALLSLYTADGRLAGFRQSGVGSMRPGFGEAIFGCPDDGPYRLVVVYPSSRERPVVRSGLRPGTRVLLIEPSWDGPLGALAGSLGVGWRSYVRRCALVGWSVIAPLATLFGVIAGATLFTFSPALRRILLRFSRNRVRMAMGVAPGGAAPDILEFDGRLSPVLARYLAGTVTAGGGIVLLVVPFWPHDPTSGSAGRLGLAGLLFGVALGLGVTHLDTTRRRALLGALPGDDRRTRLLEALDGFSHARWLKYLAGLASLSGSLTEGADPRAVLPHLENRLSSYEKLIRPQMAEIARLLLHCDLGQGATFRSGFDSIDRDIRRIREGGALSVPPSVLSSLAEAAARMQETVRQMFIELGAAMSSEIPAVLGLAMERSREEAREVEFAVQSDGDLPVVFAPPGELSNILENLLANAARAALLTAHQRSPRVAVETIREGGFIIILVKDTGPGIPAARQEEIFVPSSVHLESRGRGLPYARRRLQLWDGRIHVASSSPEEGTTMCVRLHSLESRREGTDGSRERRL